MRLLPRATSLLVLAAATVCAVAARAEPPAPAAPRPVEELSARHILVTHAGSDARATRTKAEAQARAAEARAELVKPGADFAAVSHKYSDDVAADRRGGFLDIFSPETMDGEITAAVRSLKEGEISQPIETKLGFHVLQRLAIADAVALLKASTACVLGIVCQYQGATLPGLPDDSAKRTKEQAKAAADAALLHLKNGGTVDTIPKELGARSLRKQGWVYAPFERGLTPPIYRPALEDAAFATPVGGLSGPTDTLVGWAILKRIPWFRAHVKQILVMHLDSRNLPPNVRRSKEQAFARATEALARLRADPGAWSKAVAEFSDEPGAAARDGEMRLAQPPTGNPRELDEAISGLAPGALSGIVETRFGYHLLRRFE